MRHRGIILVLVFLLVLLLSSTVTYGGFFDLYPNLSILFISGFQVNLGLPKKDPTDPSGRREYLEKENAIYVGFWSQDPEWQIFLTGEDFTTSGEHKVPLTQLEWRSLEKNYRRMPRAGRPVCIMDSQDFAGEETSFHLVYLSYRLELTGNEMAGRYRAPIVITMVFP